MYPQKKKKKIKVLHASLSPWHALILAFGLSGFICDFNFTKECREKRFHHKTMYMTKTPTAEVHIKSCICISSLVS